MWGWLARVFTPRKRAPAKAGGSALAAARRELLRNGIPGTWIAIEGLRQTVHGVSGTHLRLKVLHWDHRLVACFPALEKDLVRRLAVLDSARLLRPQGVSWQFTLPEGAGCPADLPAASTWRMRPQ